MIIDISRVWGAIDWLSVEWPGEFSGMMFSYNTKDIIYVYDFVLMDLGSYAYTEIPPERLLPLLDRKDIAHMKGWFHRHPIGNGYPGKHNWSTTDEENIWNTPLGSTPQFVKWSFSVVLTPGGPVGRVDDYMMGTTIHCGVRTIDGENMRRFNEFSAQKDPEDLWTLHDLMEFLALRTGRQR